MDCPCAASSFKGFIRYLPRETVLQYHPERLRSGYIPPKDLAFCNLGSRFFTAFRMTSYVVRRLHTVSKLNCFAVAPFQGFDLFDPAMMALLVAVFGR